MALMTYPKKVVIGDITVRDGFQHEEIFIPTDDCGEISAFFHDLNPTKIDSETRDRLQALIEQSGFPARDFLARLVGSYEACQVQASIGQVKEIEALRHHLARGEEIYINFAKGAADRQEADALRITQAEEAIKEAKAAVMDAKKEAMVLG